MLKEDGQHPTAPSGPGFGDRRGEETGSAPSWILLGL